MFQERQLSPRILHFGKNQLFWECNELFANETYPEGLSNHHSSHPLGAPRSGSSRQLLTLRQLFNWDDLPPDSSVKGHEYGLFYVWTELVKNFTSRALTFESDKLPAFAGIARRFEALLGPTYFAGLWQSPKFFATQLGWYVASPSGGEHDETYLAPSWSWASAHSAVIYGAFPSPAFRQDEKHEVIMVATHLLEAQIDLATRDPFGSVKGGFLKVQGPLNRFFNIEKGSQDNFDVFFDHKEEDRQNLYLLSLYICQWWDYTKDWDVGDDVRYWSYLVLKPIEGQPGAYRRCGRACVGGFQLASTVDPPWQTVSGHDAPCESFESEERGHVIRIY